MRRTHARSCRTAFSGIAPLNVEIGGRLKAYRLLPILRAALVAHATERLATKKIEPQTDAA
jgi:hypothetical protein